MDTKRNYVLFIDFSSFMKLTENKLDYEVGEFTATKNSRGQIIKVMAYAKFSLTSEEYHAALLYMHRICKQGHTYKEANLIAEEIAWHLPKLVEQRRMLEEQQAEANIRVLEYLIKIMS